MVSGLPGRLGTELSPLSASVKKDKSEGCTQTPENLQVSDFGRGRWKDNKGWGEESQLRVSRTDSA